jgi:acyl carrier protein
VLGYVRRFAGDFEMGIVDRIIEILWREMGVKAAEDSSFIDLGLDSLDMIVILLSVEDGFGVLISRDAAVSCDTVGDLARAVEGMDV